MKITRALIAGLIVWITIFLSFTIMSFIPGLKDSESNQYYLLYLLLIPLVIFGASYYYKKGNPANGLVVGATMAIIGLFLDAIITLPVVIIPQGGSYLSFFSNPLLLLTTVEYIIIVLLYWKLKIKK